MKHISTNELRELYQRFFESKGHARIPSAPLIPENDPSVLFTTAGMHPLVPYLKGQPHPAGQRLTDSQVCLRTTDIDDVGDATHATVFEMLGNWSLGDYFKKEAIAWSWEFLTDKQWLNLPRERLAVSVFAGDNLAPRDDESADIWRSLGISEHRIAYLDNQENWWPAGGQEKGPQGPDTEIFYWTGEDKPPQKFNPADKHWVEIWNNVFMEFDRAADDTLQPLAQKNVDTGMGLERTVMILNGKKSIYEIDTYEPLMKTIAKHWQNPDPLGIKQRLVADHIKAATFVMTENNAVLPANTEQGYVLRRLIRRAVIKAKSMGVQNYTKLMTEGMDAIVSAYGDTYPNMPKNVHSAKAEMTKEVSKFLSALPVGLKLFHALEKKIAPGAQFPGNEAFLLHSSYGFPVELTQEMAAEFGHALDQKGFQTAMQKHIALSRTASAGKFKGGLADQSDTSTKYHTATHLLHQALRQVLGTHVLQKGSNITPDRLRFDFSHPHKLTPEEIVAVERVVNETISQDLPVVRKEMTVADARNQGALGLFAHKYKDIVSVYAIGDFSLEICGGPHVSHTGEIGRVKIVKEESAGAGIRRIKAVISK